MSKNKPTKKNKTQMVTNHLKSKKTITSWQAINLYKATRLSAIIFNLKNKGMKIESIGMEKKEDDGSTTRYTVYKYRG